MADKKNNHGENESNNGEKEPRLTDILKKVASVGIGAAFMTEDTIRGVIQDLPLPKDIIEGLLDNAKRQKTEIMTTVKGEIKNYLNKVDPTKEIDKILEKYEIRVDAKLTFHRKKPEKSDS